MENLEPWYGVRLIYQLHGLSEEVYQNVYEERILIVRAESGEAAIEKAEEYSKDYENATIEYLGCANSFNIFDENGPCLGPGTEVFSVLQKSSLPPDDYLDRLDHQGLQPDPAASLLYDRDFHQWTQVMAEALRSRDWSGLDVENLVEEVESLGRQQRQELRNRLGVLLGHLLKWQFQPAARSKSWKLTLREQRAQIRFLLKDSPSLKPYLDEAIAEGYTLGQLLVAKETLLEIEDLPEVCPYSVDDTIDDAFLPK